MESQLTLKDMVDDCQGVYTQAAITPLAESFDQGEIINIKLERNDAVCLDFNQLQMVYRPVY